MISVLIQENSRQRKGRGGAEQEGKACCHQKKYHSKNSGFNRGRARRMVQKKTGSFGWKLREDKRESCKQTKKGYLVKHDSGGRRAGG